MRARSKLIEQSHRERFTPPSSEVLEDLDWFTFVCSWCGRETFVGKEPRQNTADFWLMCEWLYGVPPICVSCMRPDQDA